MISGFPDVSMEPQIRYDLCLETPEYFEHCKKRPNPFWKLWGLPIYASKINKKWNTEKAGCYIPKIRIIFLGNLEYGINIFQKAWHWDLAILDSCNLGNYATSTWIHGILDTLELWSFGTKTWSDEETKKRGNETIEETKKPKTPFYFQWKGLCIFILVNRWSLVHGSWLKARGLCLKARGSRPRKISARVRRLEDPAPNFYWPWATSLEAWAISLEPWAMNHQPLIID